MVQFTIHDGSIAVDYLLDQASELCGCECQTAWEEVGRVSPTEMPYIFERVMDRPYKFFRLRRRQGHHKRQTTRCPNQFAGSDGRN